MTVRALLVDDGAAPLAVPISAVRAVVARLELTPVPTAPPSVLGLANVRGDVVAVLDVGVLRGAPAQGAPAVDPAALVPPYVVVVETRVGLAGLAVRAMPEGVEVDDDAVADVDALVAP